MDSRPNSNIFCAYPHTIIFSILCSVDSRCYLGFFGHADSGNYQLSYYIAIPPFTEPTIISIFVNLRWLGFNVFVSGLSHKMMTLWPNHSPEPTH